MRLQKGFAIFYSLVYFDGEIEGDRIVFDYRLNEGVVSKRNGLLILKLMEIGDSI